MRQVRAGLEWTAYIDLLPSVRLPQRPRSRQDVRHGVARPSELAIARGVHARGSRAVPTAQATARRLHLLGARIRSWRLDVGSILHEGHDGLHR